jgi:hypothetical protein
VQLNSAIEAASFTKNQSYFVYDFSSISASIHRCQISYGTINAIGTADGLPSDAHIRFVGLPDVITGDDVMSAGAIVTPYRHRFTTFGRIYPGLVDFNSPSYGYGRIPYCSYNATLDAYQYYGQTSQIYSSLVVDREYQTLIRYAPGDDGAYAIQRPALLEYQSHNPASTTGMNRRWGEMKNIFICDDNGMQMMQTGRIINSKNYICIGDEDSWFTGGADTLSLLCQHTEET